MLNLKIEIEGKRVDTLLEGLQLVVQRLRDYEGSAVRPIAASSQIYDQNRVDGKVELELTGETISYSIVGIKEDGQVIELARGYPAESYCYASATKMAIDLENRGFVRLGLMDNSGRVLNYETDQSLQVKNEHDNR